MLCCINIHAHQSMLSSSISAFAKTPMCSVVVSNKCAHAIASKYIGHTVHAWLLLNYLILYHCPSTFMCAAVQIPPCWHVVAVKSIPHHLYIGVCLSTRASMCPALALHPYIPLCFQIQGTTSPLRGTAVSVSM